MRSASGRRAERWKGPFTSSAPRRPLPAVCCCCAATAVARSAAALVRSVLLGADRGECHPVRGRGGGPRNGPVGIPPPGGPGRGGAAAVRADLGGQVAPALGGCCCGSGRGVFP